MKYCLSLLVLALLAAVGAPTVHAVEIGQQVPGWKNLEGVDGKRHSLSDLQDAQAVVVAFTCNHCPVAKAYEDRFMDFTKKYNEQGVAFVAINVITNNPADKLPAMQQRAEERGFNFPYLYDPSQETGRQFEAQCTPHVFLLDKDRKLVYAGAFDDNINVRNVDETYLQDAVDAVLAGKTPNPQRTRARGCGIKYDK